MFLGLKTKTSPEGPAVHARYIVTFRPEAIEEVHQGVKRMKLDEAPGGNDPLEASDFGNAFLLRQGFTMLWSAWTWDVAADPKDRRLILKPPVATRDGMPWARSMTAMAEAKYSQ